MPYNQHFTERDDRRAEQDHCQIGERQQIILWPSLHIETKLCGIEKTVQSLREEEQIILIKK